MKLFALAVLLVLVFIVAPIAYERMLWNECRATNSFFYCVRVLA